MSVDDDDDYDDDDDDDDYIDGQSNDLPCIEENGADSSEDDDNDNDGDDDDDKDSQQTFLVFCDRHGNHSPQNVFSHVSSSSVSDSWFPNNNQYRLAIGLSAAHVCASSSGFASHEMETHLPHYNQLDEKRSNRTTFNGREMIETTTMLASYIPTSSVGLSPASTIVSLSGNDDSSPLHLASALESGIESLEMHDYSDFDSPDLADMLDDWLPLIQ